MRLILRFRRKWELGLTKTMMGGIADELGSLVMLSKTLEAMDDLNKMITSLDLELNLLEGSDLALTIGDGAAAHGAGPPTGPVVDPVHPAETDGSITQLPFLR
jgi:hypothetical protein